MKVCVRNPAAVQEINHNQLKLNDLYVILIKSIWCKGSYILQNRLILGIIASKEWLY
jgi:hypothetical protein